MILTRKRLQVDIFLTRRLSKSLAFCNFASVNFEPWSLDREQEFIYLKPVNLFQKMTAPENEGTERRSPGTPNGDVMVHSDEERERYDYLETNFKYPLMFIVISSMWVT